jgi:hypothetical protein
MGAKDGQGAQLPYAIRKRISHVEEIWHEGGPPREQPLVKAAVGVVIQNPFASRFEPDLAALTAPSAELGKSLAERALQLLNGRAAESYGKGGIAGTAGEQEHVVACITTVFGDALRDAVGGGAAWISSASKTGTAGTPIDLPLAHKDALFVRSHYDAITLAVTDAPRPAELLIAIAVATGGRIHERVGGLRADQALGDGLR